MNSICRSEGDSLPACAKPDVLYQVRLHHSFPTCIHLCDECLQLILDDTHPLRAFLQSRIYANIPAATMRLFLLTLFLAFILATAYAVRESQKAVLITYPSGTPQSEVDKAIDAVKSAGGIITHEFGELTIFKCKESAVDR